ncbi:Uncharacterised protein [Bordetella pertussis]|nr:Uncharacterised protein [Bordetella pertussis]
MPSDSARMLVSALSARPRLNRISSIQSSLRRRPK